MKKILLIACLFFFLAGTASANQGSYFQNQLQTASKKCPKKNTKCKKKAYRTALARTNAKVRKDPYGFTLRSSDIPARSGKLIWAKPIRASRTLRQSFVLYSSRSFPSGKKIAVSGVAALPARKPPRGGFPVISWAHGTTGISDLCAPSKAGAAAYGSSDSLLLRWLQKGYAVLATDYEGLGTPGTHPYLVGESEGRGVVDIVPASRQLYPQLSKRVVLAGHSQGGHAALFAARSDRQMPFVHKATLAYAPPAFLDIQAQLIGTQPDDAYSVAALASTILMGATEADPRIDPAQLLQPEALQLYPQTRNLCLDGLSSAFEEAGVGPRELLLPGWQNTENGGYFMQALKDINPSLAVSKKLLVLQGLDDTTVLSLFTNNLIDELQSLSPGLVSYFTYDDWLQAPTADYQTAAPSTHSSILEDSLAQSDSFLQNAFR